MKYLILALFLSCSTIRLKVEAPYETSAGNGKMAFQKSYQLASFPWICGFTAIFYGGGCWAYLVMPMVPQEKKVIEDAKEELKNKLNVTEVTLVEPKVIQLSWVNAPDLLILNGEAPKFQ